MRAHPAHRRDVVGERPRQRRGAQHVLVGEFARGQAGVGIGHRRARPGTQIADIARQRGREREFGAGDAARVAAGGLGQKLAQPSRLVRARLQPVEFGARQQPDKSVRLGRDHAIFGPQRRVAARGVEPAELAPRLPRDLRGDGLGRSRSALGRSRAGRRRIDVGEHLRRRGGGIGAGAVGAGCAAADPAPVPVAAMSAAAIRAQGMRKRRIPCGRRISRVPRCAWRASAAARASPARAPCWDDRCRLRCSSRR